MDFGKISVRVDGEQISFDVDKELEINDISEEMDRVAAQIGYWGSIWASAEGERIKADAFYRGWRANFGEELLRTVPKLSEWKVKGTIESDPRFQKLKAGVAVATQHVILARNIVEAFKTKAEMLRSKGAMMRSELDSTGMTTKDRRIEKEEEERIRNKAMLKRTLKKKKR